MKPYPKYISAALSVLRPPQKITVSEWADKYRVLSEKDTAAPGAWQTSKTPYLRGVMDAFCDKRIQDITFCAGTQIGKTSAEQNMIGYAIDQDPGPMMIVYPTDKLAEFTSENRLQPMFRLSPPLAENFLETESQRLELQFPHMYIALIGANSPANLSSRPVRYVFFDEIDKFPKWTGDEASPMELAAERTKTFWNRKLVRVSTPTLEIGNIWQAWLRADAQYKYFVPCPYCGHFQELEMKQVKWPEGATPQEALYAAYYECVHCKEHIDDQHKIEMIRQGEWRRVDDKKHRVRSVAFHLSSLYSPWVAFGDIASKFLSVKDTPELLMNFVNSWLAEPWKDKADSMRSDIVMNKRQPYHRGIVPKDVQILTMGVDVQLDHFWVGVRGWGASMTSYLIDYSRVETWGDVEEWLNRMYPDENGEPHNVNLCCIDSGFHTDEVYAFCTQHLGLAIPTKGSSRQMTTRYSINRIDKAMGAMGSLNLYFFDTNQFKDFIAGRLSIGAGRPGSWNLYDECDRRYADMICAEQKVQHQDKKGHITFSWEPISSHAQNHMLDVETNNALAAEILGVRYLQREPAPQPKPKQEKKFRDDYPDLDYPDFDM